MAEHEKTKRIHLTPAIDSELHWLAAEGPPHLARHARIILGLAKGMTVAEVSRTIGVHSNTVRNCLRRFEAQGIRGLGHGAVGQPKNQAFAESVRDEISRVAMHSPRNAGEAIDRWSLRLLQSHLLKRGVVQQISVEGLRQLLRGLPLPAVYWRRSVRPSGALTPDVRHALESLRESARADRRVRAQIVLASSQGLNETEIAAALHVSRATVRRWLQRFRRAGILGLETLPRSTVISLQTRQQITRIAGDSPRSFGLDRDSWSVASLRRVLIRRRIAPSISSSQLAQILAERSSAAGSPVDPSRHLSQEPAIATG